MGHGFGFSRDSILRKKMLWSEGCPPHSILYISYLSIYLSIYKYIYIWTCVYSAYINTRLPLRPVTYPHIPWPTIKFLYISLHTLTSHFLLLDSITYHQMPLHYITLHHITSHYIALHHITPHYIICVHMCIYVYTSRIMKISNLSRDASMPESRICTRQTSRWSLRLPCHPPRPRSAKPMANCSSQHSTSMAIGHHRLLVGLLSGITQQEITKNTDPGRGWKITGHWTWSIWIISMDRKMRFFLSFYKDILEQYIQNWMVKICGSGWANGTTSNTNRTTQDQKLTIESFSLSAKKTLVICQFRSPTSIPKHRSVSEFVDWPFGEPACQINSNQPSKIKQVLLAKVLGTY